MSCPKALKLTEAIKVKKRKKILSLGQGDPTGDFETKLSGAVGCFRQVWATSGTSIPSKYILVLTPLKQEVAAEGGKILGFSNPKNKISFFKKNNLLKNAMKPTNFDTKTLQEEFFPLTPHLPPRGCGFFWSPPEAGNHEKISQPPHTSGPLDTGHVCSQHSPLTSYEQRPNLSASAPTDPIPEGKSLRSPEMALSHSGAEMRPESREDSTSDLRSWRKDFLKKCCFGDFPQV